MTGRRLYDKFCDARHATIGNWPETMASSNLRSTPPVAWPFLPFRERNMWSDLARRITPRKRRAAR